MIQVTERSAALERERALSIATLTTACSLIPTAYVTLASNSVVLLGDLLRCVVEFLSILLSWIIIRRVHRSDRTFYDYGFGKLEHLASMGVAFAMLTTFIIVTLTALQRILAPQTVEGGGAGFILAILSVAGNMFLWFQNQSLCRRSFSPVLESQSKLFRAKAVASLVVVASLGLTFVLPSSTWTPFFDPTGSLILAAFLLYSAVGLLSSSMNDLLDRSVGEALRLVTLTVLVKNESLYSGFHGFRTRRAGSKIFVEVFLEFAGHLTMREVGSATSKLRAALQENLAGSDVTVVAVPAQE